jgi:hypothetical protein
VAGMTADKVDVGAIEATEQEGLELRTDSEPKQPHQPSEPSPLFLRSIYNHHFIHLLSHYRHDILSCYPEGTYALCLSEASVRTSRVHGRFTVIE